MMNSIVSHRQLGGGKVRVYFENGISRKVSWAELKRLRNARGVVNDLNPGRIKILSKLKSETEKVSIRSFSSGTLYLNCPKCDKKITGKLKKLKRGLICFECGQGIRGVLKKLSIKLWIVGNDVFWPAECPICGDFRIKSDPISFFPYYRCEKCGTILEGVMQ